MPYHSDMPCRITDGPQYDDDDVVPGLDDLDEFDAEAENALVVPSRHRLGQDINGEDDDAFELRRTIKDIAGTDIPALMRRQAD